jgi:hypothetical protein
VENGDVIVWRKNALIFTRRYYSVRHTNFNPNPKAKKIQNAVIADPRMLPAAVSGTMPAAYLDD